MGKETKEKVSQATSETEKTITIEESKLKALLNRVERLESIADKARASRYDNLNKGDFGKKVRLRTLDGKLIVGWTSMPVNVCEKNLALGRYVEEQEVKLLFEDGTDLQLPLALYIKRYSYIQGIVKKEINTGGEIEYEVELEDGRVVLIDTKFIN